MKIKIKGFWTQFQCVGVGVGGSFPTSASNASTPAGCPTIQVSFETI